MPTASPGNDQSTHHVILSSGATQVGLLICNSNGDADPLAMNREDIPGDSLRVYSGAMKHHDRGGIFEPIAQTDWSGGRGSRDFDRDTSKYGDGYGVDTTKAGRVLLGPFGAYGTGVRTLAQNWPYTVYSGSSPGTGEGYDTRPCDGTYTRYAVAVSFGSSFAAKYLYLYVRRRTASAGLVVGIKSDSSGAPSSGITYFTTGTLAAASVKPYVWTPVRISLSGATLNAGTTYWIVVNTADAAGWDILAANHGGSYSHYDGSWGSEISGAFYYRLTKDDAQAQGHFFEYKGSMWCATRSANGSVSKVFINGDQGVPTGAGSSTTALQDTTKTWAADEYKGCICRLTAGYGSDQARPWRMITGNTADTLSFSDAWDVAPVAGNTQYAIVAADKWTEVTGHGWVAQVVTDVLAVNGAVYFAHGDTTALTRMVRYNNAGTWTTTWATETGTFTYLQDAADQQGGAVWGAKAGIPAQIARAPISDWTAGTGGANLAFATAIGVGNLEDRISGMERYGDYGNLHVLKRSGIYQVIDGRPYLYQARALESSADYRNGRAVLAYDQFLYYSWHNSILRYYKGMLDRIGPDRDEDPLPSNRIGPTLALAGYSNLILEAVDAGPNGYSSIVAYNGNGWCELYRAPASGIRIWGMRVQPIDGDAVDRLWFTCGADIMWIPLSVDPLNHPLVSYNFYPFAPGGELISAWMYNELNEILKYWHSVEIQNERTLLYTIATTVSYQVDEDIDWTLIGTTDAATDEMEIGSNDVTGRRLRLAVALTTANARYTPEITAIITEAIKRLPKTYATSFLFRLRDSDVDRLGNPDDYATALAKFNALVGLEEATVPVSIASMVKTLDGKKAFIEMDNQRPFQLLLNENIEGYLGSVRLIEV